MGKITYIRGTTYLLTLNYTAPQYLGVKAVLTAKTVANDDDASDTDNAVFAPKSMSMSGSTFPQTVVFTIGPNDVPLTVNPANNYAYSVKVIDSNGDEYAVDSGTFVLKAVTTNETS